ncbi:MAG: 50S ribosomal protein L9 [Dehalococcoidia bacterium]
MKVVFFEDVEGTAQVGEVKDVKNGFARNFLLPRGIAAPSSRENIQRGMALAQKEERRLEKLDGEARKVVEIIQSHTVVMEVKVGESGRLFGSVTNRDVAAKLNSQAGTSVDAHIVQLPEPIRELGDRPVVIRFTKNVSFELPVSVVPDEESKATLARVEAEKAVATEAEAKRQAEIEFERQQRRGRRNRED